MDYIHRSLEKSLNSTLKRGMSVLLLGPRQTGKTTLLNSLRPALTLSLARPSVRWEFSKDPGLLTKMAERLPRSGDRPPLIIVDEVQKVPELMDAAQDLIDRRMACFFLTGSSARKLRRGKNVNLLPGRALSLHLDPFSLEEKPPHDLREALLYGSLPGIVALSAPEEREADLASYVTTYLEEEIRAEALVRNLGSFGRFLELAASESGLTVNFLKMSQEIGVAHTTIQDYYQILEDCLIAERIEPLTRSPTRKKLTRAQKYLFFDLGVRRAAAREGTDLIPTRMGQLFEQYVGLELIRAARLAPGRPRLSFWRDPSGPEVDWVLETQGCLTPVEVKWTANPKPNDIRHLAIFLNEYPQAKIAYVVCRTPRPLKLADRIEAIPWQDIPKLVKKP